MSGVFHSTTYHGVVKCTLEKHENGLWWDLWMYMEDGTFQTMCIYSGGEEE